MRLVRTQNVLFVNLFRPDFPDTTGRILETIREEYPDRYTEIELSPLNENESEILVN